VKYDYTIYEVFGSKYLHVSNGTMMYSKSKEQVESVMVNNVIDESGLNSYEIWFQKELCQVQASSYDWFYKDSPNFHEVKCLPWNPLETPITTVHSWDRWSCPGCAIIKLKGFNDIGWTVQDNSNAIWIYFQPGWAGGGTHQGGWEWGPRVFPDPEA